MADWRTLIEIAFIKERAQARRIALRSGCSQEQALLTLLAQIAGSQTLAELIAQRKQLTAHAQAKRLARQQAQALVRQRKQHHKQVAPTAWQAWFDGSAVPNPGRIGIGGVLRSPAGEQIEISRHAGQGDNNQAEYLALIALLQIAIDHRCDEIVVHGDSQIVIDDISGRRPVVCLDAYRWQALALLSRIPSVRFEWIPRARNEQADMLCRSANVAVPHTKKSPATAGALFVSN